MKVALYARVSRNNGQQDPETQLHDLRSFCAAQNPPWIIVGEYVDHGISGSKEHRPQLDALMRDALHGTRDIEAVVVWKFDRFARSVRHLVNTLHDLQNAGIAFVSQQDRLDTTTAQGKLMFHVIAAMAEFERAIIRERVNAGLRRARAEGKKLGRRRSSNPSRSTLWRDRQKEPMPVV